MQDRTAQLRVERIGDCTLYLGDCLEVMRGLPDASVDAVVTDPPYELGFMSKRWDNTGIAFRTDVWSECLRILKPGGHMLAFSGTRTYHRMAVAIEDAGFEVRDMLGYCYASGFPKSHNVSKGIDKRAGVERHILDTIPDRWAGKGSVFQRSTQVAAESVSITAPATEDDKKWDGWGSALKPSFEPLCLARKPLIGTIVENVLAHGTGALNIDGSRIGNNGGHAGAGAGARVLGNGLNGKAAPPIEGLGKWPANLLHDGSHECLEVFGQHSRMFFSAKAQKKDREEGLEGCEVKPPIHGKSSCAGGLQVSNSINPVINVHPTVKGTALMRWLCRLITPPGGTVLDCFMGSGSTGKAAVLEGFRFIGIEREEEYFDIACRRIADAYKQPRLFDPEPVQKPVQVAMPLLVEASRD